MPAQSADEAAEANVLGAFALLVTDSTAEAITAATGLSATAAAALSELHHFLDRPTIDTLCRALGVTPSGAVRLVDRLAEEGLVTRGAGVDGRSRSVTLTAKGRRVARRVTAARAQVLAGALASLTTAQRATLHELTGGVLAALVQQKIQSGRSGTRWICRMCDRSACGRDEGRCPAALAAMESTRDTPRGRAALPATNAR